MSPHDNLDNDLEEFKPQHWMLPNCAPISETSKVSHNKLSSRLFTPVPGSFIPFSDGQRNCLGKHFAQVEILAALAVIFSQCSVEFAVDESARDEEVTKMFTDEKMR